MFRCESVALATVAFALYGAPSFAADAPAPAAEEAVLDGGEEGTVFKSLQVTGEDLIRIEFDRPELRVDLDPRQAPGLEWGNPEDVLGQSGVDVVAPLAALSAAEPTRFVGKPWLDAYRSGTVARFRPAMEGVERWSLTIADSRSDTLAVFSGHGDPKDEIAWDGRSRKGAPVLPGIRCSYVLEAMDRAGNRRSFVGEGFVLPPYRVRTAAAEMLLFSGDDLGAAALGDGASPAPILLETASWLNQIEAVGGPIEVKAYARSFEEATQLAQRVAGALGPHVVGDPARIRASGEVRADVPDRGSVAVTAALEGTASASPRGKKSSDKAK